MIDYDDSPYEAPVTLDELRAVAAEAREAKQAANAAQWSATVGLVVLGLHIGGLL